MPYFKCSDCPNISEVKQNTGICPHCNSKRVRIMTDEEFYRLYDKGVIKLKDPSTGKPME